MVEDCQECQRLWRDYAQATNTHVRLENKLKTAALKHDHILAAALKTECDAAADARRTTREAVRLHEVEMHGEEAANDAAAV